jgi:hypothetical protein
MKISPFNIIYNIILAVSILLIILVVSSCKSNSGKPNYPVTEEDAAEVVSNAVLSQYGGLLGHINSGVQLEQKTFCGVFRDSLIIWTNQGASTPLSGHNSLQWHYQRNCADGSLNGTYSGGINYDGPRFTADNHCNATITCTPQKASVYKATIILNLQGTDHKKAVGINSLKTDINIQATDVIVDTSSGQIVSGQAKVYIHISYYDYSGTFKFLGNHLATLTLNSGIVYNLNL